VSMKPTGPTNIVVRKLIDDILEKGYKENIRFLINLAKQLKTPTRRKIEANLGKLQRLCKDGETIVIPGKLLSYGELNKKLTIACLSYSKTAREKAEKSGSKIISIEELIKQNPTGKNVRLIK